MHKTQLVGSQMYTIECAASNKQTQCVKKNTLCDEKIDRYCDTHALGKGVQ